MQRLPYSFQLTAALAAALLFLAPGTGLQASPTDGAGEDSGTSAGTPRESEKEAQRRQEREKKAQKEQAKKKGGSSKAAKQRRKQEAAQAKVNLDAKTAPQWYEEAVRRHRLGKYLDARAVLLPLEDSPRAADMQEQIKLLLADTYFYQGGELNYAEALARYRSFLTFFPGSSSADYAQFQLGECYFRQLGRPDRDQSYTEQAIAEFQRLQDVFPDSEHVAKARANAAEARALQGRHDFQIARFYWDWKNYDAAVARLHGMLLERPESPEREEALYLAAQGSYNLGRQADGDAYAERLRQDYPASRFLKSVGASGSNASALQAAAKRDRRRAVELERLTRRQAKRDARRTRQIRKDMGLTGNVQVAGSEGSAGAPAKMRDPAPPREASSPAEPTRKEQKAERLRQERMVEGLQQSDSEKRRMERKEQREAEELRQRGQRDSGSAAKREAEDARRIAKAAAKDAANAAQAGGGAGQADSKQAAKAAAQAETARRKAEKAAAKERERMERLEREEAEQEAREAAQKAQQDAKKKAEKGAKKKTEKEPKKKAEQGEAP